MTGDEMERPPMFHARRKTLFAFILLISLFALSYVSRSLRGGIDYQAAADRTAWDWSDQRTNPLSCADNDKYDTVLVMRCKDHSLTIKIMEGDRQAYSWSGHMRSVFGIVGDRLFYVSFHPSSDGGAVVAVDLKSGNELWRSPLTGVGPVEHSAYSNLINLDVHEPGLVKIYGNESGGRYFEIKDAETGKTVGHKVY